MLGSDLHQRMDGDVAETLASGEEGKFDDEGTGHGLTTDPTDQLERRFHGSPGREQVVDHQHAVPALDGVCVDLDRVPALCRGEGCLQRLIVFDGAD